MSRQRTLYSPTGHTAYYHVGADDNPSSSSSSSSSTVVQVVGWAAVGASAYHGYKRNNSVGWALVWGLLGGLAPIITVPVAFAQGFGKRKGS